MLELDVDFLTKGVVIGFAMAAPVGPIGVLCIRRTLTVGIVSGVATGLGAALADAIYGAIAAFGMVSISEYLKIISPYMQLFGSIFLLIVGVKTFLTRPKMTETVTDSDKHPHNARELVNDFFSSFLMTLTNPATMLAFIAIFATLGLVVPDEPHYEQSVMLVTGVFGGSLAWWCVLSGGIGLFRHKLDRKGLRMINMASGMVIGSFGAAMLGRVVVEKLMKMF